MATIAKGASTGGSAAYALRMFAVMLGVFFLFNGIGKLSWFLDGGVLADRLDQWLAGAHLASRWYIENLKPGIPLFARLVPAGEIAVGVALVLGFWTRLAALVGLLMVANFHVAQGLMFSTQILTDGVGLPVLGGLLALGIAGDRLPLSVSK